MNTRYYPLFAIICAIVLLIIFAVIFMSGRTKNTDRTPINATPTSQYTKNEETELVKDMIVRADPDTSVLLEADQPQTFTLTSTSFSAASLFTVRLEEKSFGSETSIEKNEISTSQPGSSQIALQTKFPLRPDTYYVLSVIQKSSNKTLFQTTYQTNRPEPTNNPLKSNTEKTLSAYLPKQTDSYTLLYNKDRNVYIFHFIFQSDKSGSIQAQFEQAKNDAQTFIKSIGIDPSTLSIEWKHS